LANQGSPGDGKFREGEDSKGTSQERGVIQGLNIVVRPKKTLNIQRRVSNQRKDRRGKNPLWKKKKEKRKEGGQSIRLELNPYKGEG